jgi:DNA invertase Pin-like site-specific DNA recombinase
LSGKDNPMYGVQLYGPSNGNYGKLMKPHVKEALLKKRRKLSDAQIEEIRHLFIMEKFSQTELSKKFDISLTQIHRIVHNKSWRSNPNRNVKKKNMTIKDARKIKQLYSSGLYSYAEIAKKYNCSPIHIYRIIKGLKWKNA